MLNCSPLHELIFPPVNNKTTFNLLGAGNREQQESGEPLYGAQDADQSQDADRCDMPARVARARVRSERPSPRAAGAPTRSSNVFARRASPSRAACACGTSNEEPERASSSHAFTRVRGTCAATLPSGSVPRACRRLLRAQPLTSSGEAGKEIEFDIEPTDTVKRIKERVEEKEGIPPPQQVRRRPT
jgi:hypothetical protein